MVAQSPPPPQARMQSPQPTQQQVSPSLQQHPYAMPNPAALAYVSQQQQQLLPQQMSPVMGGMSPMMQHPIAQMGGLNAPYAMQNIMRNPSPGPVPVNAQYMDMQGNRF
jgi:YTH domain-containing family protein